MKLTSIIKTIQTYRHPLKYYALQTGWYRPSQTTLQLRNGLTFVLRPHRNDHFTLTDTFVKGDYESALTSLNPATSVVIDIGAHIGDFTLQAAKTSKQVIAYEPAPENIKLLKINKRLNQLTNIVIRPVAVAAQAGVKHMHLNPQSSSANTFYQQKETRQPGTTVKIKCVNLNDEIEKFKLSNIDLIKLDCEGAEYEILRNLNPSNWNKTKNIILEYHLWAHVGYTLDDLQKLLKSKGFQIHSHKPINSQLGILFLTK